MEEEISLKSLVNKLSDLGVDEPGFDNKVDLQEAASPDDDLGNIDQELELDEDVQKAIQKNVGNVVDIVQQWLSSNPQSVNARDSEGMTALHHAVAHCNTQVADILLKARADPNATDNEDRTVLHHLCKLEECGNVNLTDFADLLWNKVANVDAQDSEGCTALHYAAENGHLVIAMRLLDMGADMTIRESQLEGTPVDMAAKSSHHEVLAEMIKRIPTCVQLTNFENETPLFRAVADGTYEATKVILDSPCKPDVNTKSIFGYTPLHVAAFQGSVDVARLLVEYGADVNPPRSSDSERTPFHMAAFYGQTDLALFLLENGAKVTASAFMDIVKEGYENIAKTVIESDQWPLALRGSYEYHGKITTPFRQLIVRMPVVAEMVLNRCIVETCETRAKNRRDHGYSVLYNYEFIEDCHEEDCQSDNEMQPGTTTEQEDFGKKSKTYGCSFVEVKERNACPTWGPSKFSKVEHPLEIMVNRKELKLLRHPVVGSLIHHKWEQFGLISYIVNLMIYAVFLTFLTAFALVVPNPQSPVCTSKTNGTETNCPGPSDQLGIFLIISSLIVLLMSGCRLVFEIIQFAHKRLSYVTDWVNWVEIIQYISSIIFVVVYGTKCFCVLNWQWQVGVVAVFLGWISLILFVSKLPFIGIYVIILIRICNTFAKMLFLTLLLIIAFGLTFYMIFFDFNVTRSPFSDVPRSFLKTMTMTTGELDYGDIFRLNPAGENDDLQEIEYSPISYILWISFIVVMPVIFTNMLTSLAVGDTGTVQEEAQLEKLAQQVDQILAMEGLFAVFKKCLPSKWRAISYREIFPNTPKKQRSILYEPSFRLWEGDRYDHRDVIMKALRPPEVEGEEILQSTEAISEEVKVINQKLCHFQHLLEDIAQKIDVQSASHTSSS